MVRARTAGDDIDANCTRCRMILNHTIVAMVESRVVRVKCNTCGGEHAYHAPKEERKSESSRAAAPRRTATTKAPAAPAHDWATELASHPDKTPVPYRMDATFRADDLVTHPTFGIGIVKKIMKPNKMEILFKDGMKLLRCTA